MWNMEEFNKESEEAKQGSSAGRTPFSIGRHEGKCTKYMIFEKEEDGVKSYTLGLIFVGAEEDNKHMSALKIMGSNKISPKFILMPMEAVEIDSTPASFGVSPVQNHKRFLELVGECFVGRYANLNVTENNYGENPTQISYINKSSKNGQLNTRISLSEMAKKLSPQGNATMYPSNDQFSQMSSQGTNNGWD